VDKHVHVALEWDVCRPVEPSSAACDSIAPSVKDGHAEKASLPIWEHSHVPCTYVCHSGRSSANGRAHQVVAIDHPAELHDHDVLGIVKVGVAVHGKGDNVVELVRVLGIPVPNVIVVVRHLAQLLVLLPVGTGTLLRAIAHNVAALGAVEALSGRGGHVGALLADAGATAHVHFVYGFATSFVKSETIKYSRIH